jgi:hypothetical protein
LTSREEPDARLDERRSDLEPANPFLIPAFPKDRAEPVPVGAWLAKFTNGTFRHPQTARGHLMIQ